MLVVLLLSFVVVLSVALLALVSRPRRAIRAASASGYALIAPCEGEPAFSPPRSPSDSECNDENERSRAEVQPLLGERRFWSSQMNSAIVAAANQPSYNGNFTCLAPGLHVSNFELDHSPTMSRLQKIVDGSLPRSSTLAEPWRGVETWTLAAVLRVLCLLDECAEGHLSLALLVQAFYNFELPNTLERLQANVIRTVGRCAPVMLVSTGATEASLHERLTTGERLVFHRPTELLPVLSLYKALGAHEAIVINQQLSRIAGLPLAELQAMAGSTEAKKVLIAAVSHLSGKRRLAKFHDISMGKIECANSAVDASLIELGKVHDQVYARLAEERERYQTEAAELGVAAEAARRQSKAARVIADLEHRAELRHRAVAQRDPYGPDFGPIFKRRWREAAMMLDGLKHLPRGHNPSIHVKYPNFKEAVQSITHDLNGRADKGRNSATVYLGNSTWQTIADRLADPVYMSTLGGAIPASVSALKRHKARSARSKQPKCTDPEGQLNVGSQKFAKLLLPTAVEQPNGHMLNLTIKELERFGMLNAYFVDLINRDDKANFQLDNVYRKARLLQELLRNRSAGRHQFNNDDGQFDRESYERAAKAETHDHVTATGYRLIATSNACMSLGSAAAELPSPGDAPPPLQFDTSLQTARDAKLFVTVRNLKLQPSTPFQHARDLLWRVENFREWHTSPPPQPQPAAPAVPAVTAATHSRPLKPMKIIIVDGGGDENPRFFNQIMCNTIVFLRCRYEHLIVAAAAAGFTPLRLVEFCNGSLSMSLDGAFIASDTYGSVTVDSKTGKVSDPALEEQNLRHACNEMAKYMSGGESFGFPITAVCAPRVADLSPFASIDESALLAYRDAAGGCGCKTGCEGRRCQKCRVKGRPCTWRCACKGRCSNRQALPPPQGFSASELRSLPLEQIVLRLAPCDIEYFAAHHSTLCHYATQLVLCPPSAAAACWYCSRFGERRLPAELQGRALPLYSTPDAAGTDWKRLPERWADVVAGRGGEFFQDASLPSRLVAAAYAEQKTATPPEHVIGELVRRTLLDAKDIRELFVVLHRKATSKSNWTAAHQPTIGSAFAAAAMVGGCGDCDEEDGEITVDDNVRQYDGSLVGRRITLLWRPRGAAGEPQPSDYYPATIVSYKSSNHKYKFIIHFDDRFDDGSSAEAVGLPDETVRIMTQTVSMCTCPSCDEGVDGGHQLPLPWELAKQSI